MLGLRRLYHVLVENFVLLLPQLIGQEVLNQIVERLSVDVVIVDAR